MKVAIRYKHLLCDEPGDYYIAHYFLESFAYDESEERNIPTDYGTDAENAYIFNLADTKDVKLMTELSMDFGVPSAPPSRSEMQVIGVELVLVEEELILDDYDDLDDEEAKLEPSDSQPQLHLVNREAPSN